MTIESIALLYFAGAIIVGPVVASHEKVSATWHGKPLPFQRTICGIVAGVIWPYALLRMVWRLIGRK